MPSSKQNTPPKVEAPVTYEVGPPRNTPGGFGFYADLITATGDDLDSRVSWMSVLHDIDKATALAVQREGILL